VNSFIFGELTILIFLKDILAIVDTCF